MDEGVWEIDLGDQTSIVKIPERGSSKDATKIKLNN